MNEREEIKKINTWLSFYFIQFDTSPLALLEGRVHPIQFSNSITRINAAGRSFREKKLFLGIVLWMALVIIIVYPFLDTDYFLPILLIFGPIILIDYIYYSILQTKAASLLLSIVQQENELFAGHGMRLKFYPYIDKLEMELIGPSRLGTIQDSYFMPSTSFQTLHEQYATPSVYDESGPSSRRSSSSSALADIEPLSGYESTPSLLRQAITRVTPPYYASQSSSSIRGPSSPSTRLVDAVFIAKTVVPQATPARLVDADISSTSQPSTNPISFPETTSTILQSSFVDPDMPEGISISPPPLMGSERVAKINTAPIARRSALSSSDSFSLLTKKRGRRVSISDNVCVFNEREHSVHPEVIYEEGSGNM